MFNLTDKKNYSVTFITIARSSSDSSKIGNCKVTEGLNFHFMKKATVNLSTLS
jgi:hypothetical protein